MKVIFKVYQVIGVHGHIEHGFHKTFNTIPDATNPIIEMSGFETEAEAEAWLSTHHSTGTFTIVKEYSS